jgi:hypothetical protein
LFCFQGFIWEPKSHQDFWKVQGSNKKAEDLWENNFAELMEYRDEHGDCLVPKEFPPNQRLARWVTKQRKHYKAKQEGRYHSLDDDKERRLVEVGFVFNTKTKELMRDSVLRRYEDRWEEFCEKLQAFKREFGHAAVPRRWKRDPQLASWVMRQVRSSSGSDAWNGPLPASADAAPSFLALTCTVCRYVCRVLPSPFSVH